MVAPVRLGAGLEQMPSLGLRDLPLGHGLERELNRLVAVGLHRLHLNHGTRPRLDHGDNGYLPCLRIEDLGHADLPAEDSLHVLT